MATDVAPNPHSFAFVLAGLARQGYLSPWDDDHDDEELPSPTQPVASYSQHERSDSQSSSSSQDSFYTLYDEPLEGDDETSESETRPETPRAWDDSGSRQRAGQAALESSRADFTPDKPEQERVGKTPSPKAPSRDTTPQYTPRNSILVSTTTTIQHTPPGSFCGKTTALRPPMTETVIAGNVKESKPVEKSPVDYSKPLPRLSTKRTPSPIIVSNPSPVGSHSSNDFDHIITEEELLELEEEITPRPRPRTKNLAKIFGQDPKNTYPSPLSSPLPVEVTKRQGSDSETAGPVLSRPIELESSESHIGDIRKKLAWRPTALSSAEEEADRRDLARLLGDDDTLVGKLFGDESEASSTRKASSEKNAHEDTPRNKSVTDDSSSPDFRRRPAWRSTALSEGQKAADERDLHELMLGNAGGDVAAQLFDPQPTWLEDDLGPAVGVAVTAGPSHERNISGPPAIPPRVTSAKPSSVQSFVPDGLPQSRPTTAGHGAVPSTPPRPGTSSTATPIAASAADANADADVETGSESETGTEADFSGFSGLSPAAQFDMPNTPTSLNRPSGERPTSRAGTPSRLGSIRQLTAYVDPIRDIFRFNTKSHNVEPMPHRADSLSSDSTISNVSDQASPEFPRAESPLSETEGSSDREKTVEAVESDSRDETAEPTTPQASHYNVDLRPFGQPRHQPNPSASTGISTISTISATATNESDDEVSIISTHDLSQPPGHILARHGHPSPLASNSTRNSSQLPRPHTAPSPHISAFQPYRPATARPPSPTMSLDSAAPPPIALVRTERTSPDGSPKRRRRLGTLRDTLLLRRPSQMSISRSSKTSGAPASTIASGRPSTERSSSERGSKERSSSDRPRNSARAKPVFDAAALNQLLSQSVPYEQTVRSQTPFRSKEAASVYSKSPRRKDQVPLGLNMLAEFELSELLARQSHERSSLGTRPDRESEPCEEHDMGWDEGAENGAGFEAKRLSLVVEEN